MMQPTTSLIHSFFSCALRPLVASSCLLLVVPLSSGCSGDGDGKSSGDGSSGSSNVSGDGSGGENTGSGSGSGTGGESSSEGAGGTTTVKNLLANPEDGPAAGWAEGGCDVPIEAGLEDISSPTTVVGTGTAESCTPDAFIAAVAMGGIITFDCGTEPHTITLTEPAIVYNQDITNVVIDGGGLVTLSGGGTSRILYMNTCDPEVGFSTTHCDDQEYPQLTVQNITFIDASTEDMDLWLDEEEGEQSLAASGSAVFASGGRFKAVNTRWFNNRGLDVGQDLGGSLRVMMQYQGLPIYLVNSTFGGGEGYGNSAANGGGISSIGQDWSIYNCLFSHNSATGNGGNPRDDGTLGGGSGGAIYNDGNNLNLNICGSLFENNTVNSFGEAIFFVDNTMGGTLTLTDSIIRNNCGGSWEPSQPSISNHSSTTVNVVNSTITDCTE